MVDVAKSSTGVIMVAPGCVIAPLNVALPASDMSSCKAVIVEVSSSPLNKISLLLPIDFTTRSEDTLLILPNSVPSSCNLMSAPFASIIRSPSTSSVKSPVDKSISVPSIVMLSTTTPALDVIVPDVVMFLNPEAISAFASSTTALLAAPAPFVIPSIFSKSVSSIAADPIVNPVPVTTPDDVIAPDVIAPDIPNAPSTLMVVESSALNTPANNRSSLIVIPVESAELSSFTVNI